MKKFLKYFLLITLFTNIFLPSKLTYADTQQLSVQPDIKAKAAIAADARTGQILYAKNIDEQLPIASMTKMISMVIVIDQIREGKLKWDDKIVIPSDISQLSMDTNLSNVPLVAGKAYTVKDLFSSSIIVSANASVMALADTIAGNQQNFINLMKKKLNSWGLKNYHIITSTGLNNDSLNPKWHYTNTSADDENRMSARDMAIVASKIVNEYPEFMESAKQPTALFDNSIQMTNWNLMLNSLPVYTEGVDGLKTGTTDKAGACFSGSVNRNNFKIVTVVMNVENGREIKTERFTQTKNLIDYVYNNFKQETIKQGTSIDGYKNIKVKNAREINQPIVTSKDITFAKQNNQNTIFKVLKDETIEAPAENNTLAKELEISSPLGYLQKPLKIDLVTKNNIEKANIFINIYRDIKQLFA